MPLRVWELAKSLNMSSQRVMTRLAEMGAPARSASSLVEAATVTRLKESFGQYDAATEAGSTTPRAVTWNVGAVRPPTHPDTLRNLDRLKLHFPIVEDHQAVLARFGSQFVYSVTGRVPRFEDCGFALVRFSGAIENAFGLTREVFFFYSPHADLQIRTFRAAKQALIGLQREVTPDIMFIWSPDHRLREKLDDWSSGNFLAIPLSLPDDDPIAFIKLLRDYIFSRDLFYETTPVQGDRFFGRRRLLQTLRDDIRNQRVAGLFGLRKAGKTSVMTELRKNLSGPETIFLLRDLESLPSPPEDPVPILLRDLVDDLLTELRQRKLRTHALANLDPNPSISDFKRAFQSTLRKLSDSDITIVLMLDEIEYLTPSDRIDVHEGDMASIAQLLGGLRSLVQETDNFTFLLSGLTSAIIESGRLYGRPNPLFSWAKANFLAPFERYEADDLAKSVGQKMGITIDDGALDALFEATGGHAFLYRHLASAVVQELPIDTFHREIKKPLVLRTVNSWRRQIAGNMREMLDHIKRYYPDEAFLLEILAEEPDEFPVVADDVPLALGHLISLGLVQEIDNSYELTPVLQLL
ncbi:MULTISPECIES: translation initiation factor IF-2 N-terminal domain-containing protein [unclassified Amycolatopsis]|uniref:translation initiation factor IF-2 N-terminal domain-containing protein n=1 Tax=unclassified Amycolatopsis TaxID=2618356 RepID=UPI00287624E0|nr:MULTISPECIES: translation initiation factor IF-2 N-terminal domain-containing protein [unclassified Amycolatopsis]MDS0135769.1 translation initiation factor IF-2 N-terminal domain-containing protein [Amycolatopsis sp. 505]MDS0145630.1 translation initiation factor IF-2 N-terminal domain-containing protein [Amycolatopsis sp. CM201R]